MLVLHVNMRSTYFAYGIYWHWGNLLIYPLQLKLVRRAWAKPVRAYTNKSHRSQIVCIFLGKDCIYYTRTLLLPTVKLLVSHDTAIWEIYVLRCWVFHWHPSYSMHQHLDPAQRDIFIGLLLIGPLRTNFGDIWNKTHQILFMIMYSKMLL